MARKPKGSGYRLNDEHKAFLCQRLAVYDTPKEAAEALSEEYGITITPQSAQHYDPTRYAGRNLAKKWATVFTETRERFNQKLEADVPLANKSVRVKKMAKAAAAFEARGAWLPMVRVIESISKELGGLNTNRRELTGKDGQPLEVEHIHKTDEALRAEIAQQLGLLTLPPVYGDKQDTRH